MANQEKNNERAPYEAPRLFDLGGGIAYAAGGCRNGNKDGGSCTNGNKFTGGGSPGGTCKNGNKNVPGACKNGNKAGSSCSNGTKFK